MSSLSFLLHLPSRATPHPQTLPLQLRTNGTTISMSSSSSSKPKHNIPARDRVISFGKHKGRMLGTLPSTYLKWVSKNLRARDFEDWAKLADEVLTDPVYQDRVQWELAEKVLNGNGSVSRGSGSAVEDLLEISERFGWDNEDKATWKKIDFTLLGTSKTGRIPRIGGGESKSTLQTQHVGVFTNMKRENEGLEMEVNKEEGGERRRERRERMRLKRASETTGNGRLGPVKLGVRKNISSATRDDGSGLVKLGTDTKFSRATRNDGSRLAKLGDAKNFPSITRNEGLRVAKLGPSKDSCSVMGNDGSGSAKLGASKNLSFDRTNIESRLTKLGVGKNSTVNGRLSARLSATIEKILRRGKGEEEKKVSFGNYDGDESVRDDGLELAKLSGSKNFSWDSDNDGLSGTRGGILRREDEEVKGNFGNDDGDESGGGAVVVEEEETVKVVSPFPGREVLLNKVMTSRIRKKRL